MCLPHDEIVAIDLLPVEFDQAQQFLLAEQLGDRRHHWQQVTDHLRTNPDSPAARGGLRLGDVLLRAGEDTLTHPGTLVPSLDAEKVGRELRLRVLRAGEERELVVVIGERAAA